MDIFKMPSNFAKNFSKISKSLPGFSNKINLNPECINQFAKEIKDLKDMKDSKILKSKNIIN